MAMDPKKLKSYMAEKADEDELDEAPEEEEEEHEEEEYEEEESEEDEDYERELEDFYGDLEAAASEVEEAAVGIEEALSHDAQPSPETVEQMKAQLAEMPESVVSGIKAYLVGLPYEEVMELAEELAEEGAIGDAEQVAGWLYWAAKNVGA
jgi:hypothetical protein